MLPAARTRAVGDHLEERIAVRFAKVEGEGLRIELGGDEAELLRRLTGELRLLLEADVPDTDVVKQRLFPAAYLDPEDTEEFRNLVGDDLHAVKVESLRAVTERLGKSGPLVSSIPDDETTSWLTLLTDLRLAIGTRMDVDEAKMEADLDEGDPEAPAMSVLHWLGWVQESMLRALTETPIPEDTYPPGDD